MQKKNEVQSSCKIVFAFKDCYIKAKGKDLFFICKTGTFLIDPDFHERFVSPVFDEYMQWQIKELL